MSIRDNPELLAKKIREISLIIGQQEKNSILVGGQSVVFWSEIYKIPQTHGLTVLTEDVDFVSAKEEALHAESVLSLFYETKINIATMDETSPNSAKMSVFVPNLGKINVDFLRMITGLDTKDLSLKSSIIQIEGHSIKIINPFQLLTSKISNLGSHLNKRGPAGIAQADLAVKILNKHIEHNTQEHGIKNSYSQFEKVIKFAFSQPACFSKQFCDVDVMEAIPLHAIPEDDPFMIKRLPVAQKQVYEYRERFEAMADRMTSYGHDPNYQRFQPKP